MRHASFTETLSYTLTDHFLLLQAAQQRASSGFTAVLDDSAKLAGLLWLSARTHARTDTHLKSNTSYTNAFYKS